MGLNLKKQKMKTKNYLKIISLCMLFTTIYSCSSTNQVTNGKSIQKKKYSKGFFISRNNGVRFDNSTKQDTKIEKNSIEIALKEEHTEKISSKTDSSLNIIHKKKLDKDFIKDVSTKIPNYKEDCDEIILKNGEIIKSKILEIGVNEVKYKKCDNQTGPTYSTLKTEIFMIKYQNGTTEVFSNSATTSSNKNNNEADNASIFGIISMVSGILGLLLTLFSGYFITALLLCVGGIVFGALSLKEIRLNPTSTSSKALAKTGLITGIIGGVILFLALIGIFLFF
jgi:hypothetical protein